MKKYRFLALLLLLPMVAGLFAPPAAALDDPTVYCNNAVLYDANYGEVLYDLDAYERAYPASTTKVMTALLVVEAIEAGLLAPDGGEIFLEGRDVTHARGEVQRLSWQRLPKDSGPGRTGAGCEILGAVYHRAGTDVKKRRFPQPLPPRECRLLPSTAGSGCCYPPGWGSEGQHRYFSCYYCRTPSE